MTETDDGDPTTGDADGNIIVGRKVIPVGFNLDTLRNYLYVDEAQWWIILKEVKEALKR